MAILSAFFSLSCSFDLSPTYPKEKLIPALINLCKKEYGLEIQAKLVGTTLGVSFDDEKLLNKDMTLNQKASENIEHIFRSIFRVSLSTDAKIDFYVLAVQDRKQSAAEYILIGYVEDIKKVSHSFISHTEYLRSILREFRLNPLLLGEKLIKGLFADLNTQQPEKEIFAKYMLTQGALEPEKLIFPALSFANSEDIHFELSKIVPKQVSNTQAIFWVFVKESFNLKPEKEPWIKYFPSGFTNEYIFWVESRLYPKAIIQIIPKYYPLQENVNVRDLKTVFEQIKESRFLDDQGLPLKEIAMPDFLAMQISHRLAYDPREEKFVPHPSFDQVQAKFADGILQVEIILKDKNIEAKALLEEVRKTIQAVFRQYNFQDFELARVNFLPQNTAFSFSKEDLLQIPKK